MALISGKPLLLIFQLPILAIPGSPASPILACWGGSPAILAIFLCLPYPSALIPLHPNLAWVYPRRQFNQPNNIFEAVEDYRYPKSLRLVIPEAVKRLG
jgi:hypothetical protein